MLEQYYAYRARLCVCVFMCVCVCGECCNSPALVVDSCSSGCKTCDVYVGEVVRLSTSPQIVGNILRIYYHRRQGGPVGTSGSLLPALIIIVIP